MPNCLAPEGSEAVDGMTAAADGRAVESLRKDPCRNGEDVQDVQDGSRSVCLEAT
jgi:hypothetical protein